MIRNPLGALPNKIRTIMSGPNRIEENKIGSSPARYQPQSSPNSTRWPRRTPNTPSFRRTKSPPITTEAELEVLFIKVSARSRMGYGGRTRYNTKSIQIPVLLPTMDFFDFSKGRCCRMTEFPISQVTDKMDGNVSRSQSRVQLSEPTPGDGSHFNFLSLPLELRLKVYSCLMPPRSHKIATQYPLNGSYYTTTPPYASQSTYPGLLCAPSSNFAQHQLRLTTYVLLNQNTRNNFPHESIHTAILRTNRQLWLEAEPVLYAYSTFDFGEYVEAVLPFLKDRSVVARNCVRSIRLDVLLPNLGLQLFTHSRVEEKRREVFQELMPTVRDYCNGLRKLDVTVLCSGRSVPAWEGLVFETTILEDMLALDRDNDLALANESVRNEPREKQVMSREQKEWEFVRSMLYTPGMQGTRVKWAGFCGEDNEREKFETWLETRMGGKKNIGDCCPGRALITTKAR